MTGSSQSAAERGTGSVRCRTPGRFCRLCILAAVLAFVYVHQARGYANANAYADTATDAQGHASADVDTNIHCFANAYQHGSGYRDCFANAHRDTHVDGYGDRGSLAHAIRDRAADGYANATAGKDRRAMCWCRHCPWIGGRPGAAGRPDETVVTSLGSPPRMKTESRCIGTMSWGLRFFSRRCRPYGLNTHRG